MHNALPLIFGLITLAAGVHASGTSLLATGHENALQAVARPGSSLADSRAASAVSYWNFDGIEYFYETASSSLRVSVDHMGKILLWNSESGRLEKFDTDGLSKAVLDVLGIDTITLMDGTAIRAFSSTDLWRS